MLRNDYNTIDGEKPVIISVTAVSSDGDSDDDRVSHRPLREALRNNNPAGTSAIAQAARDLQSPPPPLQQQQQQQRHQSTNVVNNHQQQQQREPHNDCTCKDINSSQWQALTQLNGVPVAPFTLWLRPLCNRGCDYDECLFLDRVCFLQENSRALEYTCNRSLHGKYSTGYCIVKDNRDPTLKEMRPKKSFSFSSLLPSCLCSSASSEEDGGDGKIPYPPKKGQCQIVAYVVAKVRRASRCRLPLQNAMCLQQKSCDAQMKKRRFCADIQSVAVAPAFRRRGIAELLMKKTMASAFALAAELFETQPAMTRSERKQHRRQQQTSLARRRRGRGCGGGADHHEEERGTGEGQRHNYNKDDDDHENEMEEMVMGVVVSDMDDENSDADDEWEDDEDDNNNKKKNNGVYHPVGSNMMPPSLASFPPPHDNKQQPFRRRHVDPWPATFEDSSSSAKDNMAVHMTLCVRRDNPTAINLYRRLGFCFEQPAVEHFYVDGCPLDRMGAWVDSTFG